MDNSMKSIFAITPAVMENTDCLIAKVSATVINQNIGWIA